MSVKFEFTLSDADAENLFGCISSCICQSNVNLMKAIKEGDEAIEIAHRNDINYLKELKSKLLNTRT